MVEPLNDEAQGRTMLSADKEPIPSSVNLDHTAKVKKTRGHRAGQIGRPSKEVVSIAPIQEPSDAQSSSTHVSDVHDESSAEQSIRAACGSRYRGI